MTPAPESLLADLRARHAEPQRAYHTWAHIEALLALYRETQPLLNDPEAVLYAILFHDAVYEPTRADNEERSADLLREAARDLLAPATLERAAGLVLATKKHAVPADWDEAARADAALFLDMDLSILGADEARFDAYEQEVRAEYAFVSDPLFKAGRARILSDLAGRKSLFLSDWGRARFEGQARRNIARSLARLREES